MLHRINLQAESSAGDADEYIVLNLPFKRSNDKPRIFKFANLFVKQSTGVDKYFYNVAVVDYDPANNIYYLMASWMTRPYSSSKYFDMPFWMSLRFSYYNTSLNDLIGGNIIYEE